MNEKTTPSPLDIDKANAIGQLAGKIMDTGKLELDFTKASGMEIEDQRFFGKKQKTKW